MLGIQSVLEGQKGYFTGLSFTKEETERMKYLVEQQWLDVLKKNYPQKVDQFATSGRENYHSFSHEIDHHNLWSRTVRTPTAETVKEIRQMSAFSALHQEFGDFQITDELHFGHEEMSWRLVRPNEVKDVNYAHSDVWFKDINEWEISNDVTRIDLWVPLICDKGKNGLQLVPGSHLQPEKFPYHWVGRTDLRGTVLPEADFDENEIGLELILTEPGDVVIFHDSMIHKGALNRSSRCRVSLEFTILVS